MADPIEHCRYHCDPLDRLAARTPLAQTNQEGDRVNSTLMATDQQRSVLAAVTSGQHLYMAYSPYGHRDVVDAVPGLPGFNGEQPDPMTGHYLLGNGYRAYNPVLMRFNSPDSLSPFGEGGLNPYAYCIGDPINSRDPTGHKADRNQILGFVWLGLGFTGAALGLYSAVPAMKTVTKALKSGAAIPTAPMLTAAGATAQVVASTAFTTRQIIAAVNPDSPALEPLMWLTVAAGIPSLGLRISAQAVTKVTQRAAAAQARIATRKVMDDSAQLAFERMSNMAQGLVKSHAANVRRGAALTSGISGG
jgi:RHS repeat-associated protein